MNARLLSVLRQSASVFFVFGVMAYVYSCFHKYDWGHPLIKLFCFMTVFFLILFLRSHVAGEKPPRALARVETVFWGIALLVIVGHYAAGYGVGLWHPPYADIGWTTCRATSTLFQHGVNPYSVEDIDMRRDLPPEYRGFPYGPLMMIGYLPALLSPAAGYKFASLVYLTISAGLLVLLLQHNNPKGENRSATVLFALCLFFLPVRLWHDLFRQGSNDIFPVMLLLGSLLALQRARYSCSGLLLGLSFSTKFSPALFFLIPLLRNDLKLPLFKGFLGGLIPLLVFVAWDAKGIFNNVFWNRGLVVKFDSTSLYSVTPPALHFLFPLLLLLTLAYSIYRNYSMPTEYESVLTAGTLLLIVAESTFKEVHANHLIWFYPLFALIIAANRHCLFIGRRKERGLTLQKEEKRTPEA